MPDYFVVKCKPSLTLSIASELYMSHKVAAYVPKMQRIMRLPRGRPRRKIVKAVMPGFVFIRGDHLGTAMFLAARSHVRGLRGVLKVNGRQASVAEYELYCIRVDDEIDPDTPPVGSRVQVTAGPFALYEGRVDGEKDGYTEVFIEKSSYVIKIPSCLLKRL